MEKKEIKEWLKETIEEEASALEKRVTDNPELEGLEMPEDSFADLMARAKASEKAKTKHFHIRKRTLLAVALVALLAVAAGVGATGGKLFTPKVENRKEEESLKIAINSDEEDALQALDITEEEAYTEIEEKLGILALRVLDKPEGMVLGKVSIDEITGEALMEFYCGDHVLTIYENKPNSDVTFYTKPDGKIVDSTELFYLEQTIEITEIDKGDGQIFYRSQFEAGNAYYCIRSDIELEQFKNILTGLIFNSL